MATDEMRVEFRITGFSCSPRLISDALNVGATDYTSQTSSEFRGE